PYCRRQTSVPSLHSRCCRANKRKQGGCSGRPGQEMEQRGVRFALCSIGRESILYISNAKCCTAVQFCHPWSYSPERMLILGRFSGLFLLCRQIDATRPYQSTNRAKSSQRL